MVAILTAAERKTNPTQSGLAGKRFVFVLRSLELGGAERQALLLARYCAQQDARVLVLGFTEPGQTADLCDDYGIPWRIEPLDFPKSQVKRLVNLIRLAQTLRQMRPDVILSYTPIPNVMCALVWRLTGARLNVWNQRDEGVARMGGKVEQFAVHQVPLFIGNSQGGIDYLTQSFRVNPARLRIIRNGVELALPILNRAEWRAKLGVGEDCILACMVATLSGFKDHPTLLSAWKKVIDRLRSDGRDAVLLLAGRFDGMQDSVKAQAYDLELGKSIRFLGKVEDITGLLNAVDLGVFSSRSEGCPNGVLECMAMGLAVTGTDISGIREAVGPEGYPFLAPPSDADILADKIVELIRNSELRREMGGINRRRVETEFTVQQMCEEALAAISNYIR